jgi:hypothetical protein
MCRFFKYVGILLLALGILACNFAYFLIATPTPTEELLSTPEVIPTDQGHGLPQLTGNWHICMAQTGGIAGVSRTLGISNDGTVTVTDERTQKQSTRQLSSEEISKLSNLVASAHYQTVKQPMGCADCFIFTLQIDNETQKFHIQIDQVNLPATGLEPLVEFLGKILNRE